MTRLRWLLQGALFALTALPCQIAGAEGITPLPQDLPARTYDAACSSCHYRGNGKEPFGTRSPQMKATPDALVQVILYGRGPQEGKIGMPAFAPALTDADLAGLVTYLRDVAKPGTPWTGVEASIALMRKSGSREND